jgi:hypothetical protein
VDHKEFDLTIFSVATDRYISYWSTMVQSFLDTNGPNSSIQWIVFTDKSEKIDSELIEKLGDALVVAKIKHQEWPFPTLLRYQFLLSVAHKVQGRLVMHIDADMLFVNTFDFLGVEEELGMNSIAFVHHPGYFRPAGKTRGWFYIKNPKYLAKDLLMFLRLGGLGTWETNKSSRAFVSRASRKNYICGGIWLGRKDEILQLCNELSCRIDDDLKEGFIAKFHDESHLNWYKSVRSSILLSPEYCFDPTYRQLENLKPKVVAVDKNLKSQWVR